jgi:hypothetical protein
MQNQKCELKNQLFSVISRLYHHRRFPILLYQEYLKEFFGRTKMLFPAASNRQLRPAKKINCPKIAQDICP